MLNRTRCAQNISRPRANKHRYETLARSSHTASHTQANTVIQRESLPLEMPLGRMVRRVALLLARWQARLYHGARPEGLAFVPAVRLEDSACRHAKTGD